MALKTFKPVTPSLRQLVIVDHLCHSVHRHRDQFVEDAWAAVDERALTEVAQKYVFGSIFTPRLRMARGRGRVDDRKPNGCVAPRS